MRNKKILSLFVLSFFLIQIFLPSYVFAKSTDNHSSLGVSYVNLFDPQVEKSERDLISAYLDYTLAASEARKDFRIASKNLNGFLTADSTWNQLKIEDEPFSTLLSESNASKYYLIDKINPVENRLALEQEKLEQRLKALIERSSKQGIAANGLIETARALEYLYNLNDDLWAIKSDLLVKIVGLQGNISKNYLNISKLDSSNIIKKTEENTEQLDRLFWIAETKQQKARILKNEYREAEANYNRKLIEKLTDEKEKTGRLILEIEKQISFLKGTGESNEIKHASLLKKIIDVLKNRGDLISERLESITLGKATGKNFLYIPETLGKSEPTKLLVDEYKKILSGFLKATENRLVFARELKNNLRIIHDTVLKEKSLLISTIKSSSSINEKEKKKFLKKANESIKEFIVSLSILEKYVDDALSYSQNINFDRPENIITNHTKTLSIFRINKIFEELSLVSKNLDILSLSLDFQMAESILPISKHELQTNPEFTKLNDSSQLRSKYITQLFNSLEQLGSSYEEDIKLTFQLRELGSKIIKKGNTIFSEKVIQLSKILDREKKAEGSPYYEFLKATNELLKTRHSIISQIDRVIPENLDEELFYKECKNCSINQTLWSDTSSLTYAFTDVLEQIEGISSIEKYYSRDNIYSKCIDRDAQNLFELSRLIKNPPIFNLHEDGIDVIFHVGNRVVAIKGIGNPNKIVISKFGNEGDPFLITPYIGWAWNPMAAWEGIKGDVSEMAGIVVSSGNSIYNTSSNVISTARETGGKIITAYAEANKNALKIVNDVASTVGSYISKTVDVAKDVGLNIVKNAVLNDDGSVSWLKVGGYVLGGAACVATGGLACVGLAIAAGADVMKGGVDTVAMDKYAWISKEQAEWAKLGIDVASIVGGGVVNWKSAVKAGQWANMGKLGKLSTLLGVNPHDVKNLFKAKTWKGIGSAYEVLEDGRIKHFTTFMKHIPNLISRVPKALNEVKDLAGGLLSVSHFLEWLYKMKSVLPENSDEMQTIDGKKTSGTQLPGNEETEKKPTPEKLSPGEKHSPGEKYSPGPLHSPGELQKTPW